MAEAEMAAARTERQCVQEAGDDGQLAVPVGREPVRTKSAFVCWDTGLHLSSGSQGCASLSMRPGLHRLLTQSHPG